MSESAATRPRIFRLPALSWVLAALALAAGYVTFRTGVNFSAGWIWYRPEYSHGMLVPFIAAFLVWQQRDTLERLEFRGAWAGVGVLLVAIVLNAMGQLASLFIVQQYAALMALYGLVLALVGWPAFRRLWVPLLILLFMIPLPEFLYQSLSAQLQLISSRAGVWVIQQFGISVFLEGNVIDLGSMQLQVAEACSGLRYLFPLMTLGFIVAYFFKSASWKRLLVFLSSILITIGMNSLRIGLIGVSVEYGGLRMAEGVLHDFEGWVMFMASGAVLLLEVALLSRIGRDPRPWREFFGVELPPPVPHGAEIVLRPLPRSFLAACAALLVAAAVAQLLPERAESVPSRLEFVDFPLTIAGRTGERQAIDRRYMEVLQLDDYLLATFRSGGRDVRPVDMYVSWYDTQRAGRSTHSPSTCLPAGGWVVQSFAQLDLPGVAVNRHPVRANRAVISRGQDRELVYYFFKQRQRILTNEYAVKWYVFWDALTRHRTDGALVRFVTPIGEGESLSSADERLRAFTVQAAARLTPFVPD